MNDALFMATLTAKGFFNAGVLKERVQAQLTRAEAATVFLGEAIDPYISNDYTDSEPLYKLLRVMEEHSGPAEVLATRMIESIPEYAARSM